MWQWYALRSKPKKEFAAATLLARAQVEVYLPQVKAFRQPGKAPVVEPFFPGYLFARLDSQLGHLRMAGYTPGVQYVVGYGDEPWPVPDDVVLRIQERLARGKGRVPQPDFRPGDHVVISQGPLRDVEAVFDCQLSPAGRVRVLIRILERLCRAELHVAQLRRPNQAAGVA